MKKITIGVDGNDANVANKVGVSVYCYEMLLYFQKVANEDVHFIVYLRSAPREDLPKETNYFTYHVVSAPLLWSKIFLPLHLLFSTKLDVFFSPTHYSPLWLPCPLVFTMHDTAYEYYPHEFLKKDLYKLKNWTKDSVKKATKIIAVSKSTRDDSIKFYHVPPQKINLIYNGFRKHTVPKKGVDLKEKWNITRKNYILYVGTLQPRKNIPALIDAFSQIKEDFPDLKLVIVGKKGWLYEEIFDKVAQLKLHNSVLFTGYVTDDELQVLYKEASCYVLPSLYEGFGVPILEAMHSGIPVICSNNSSLPEVGGAAALYFDPLKPEDLAEKLSSLLTNKKLQLELIEKGKHQVKKFDWEKSAEETLEVLKKVAHETTR